MTLKEDECFKKDLCKWNFTDVIRCTGMRKIG